MTEPKAPKPRASRARPIVSEELVKAVYRVEAKVDYGMEDVRSAVKRIGDDHEARIRGLEKSESQRQGGNSTARFLYGGVWPALAFINSAIALYLTYKAMKP